MDQKVSTILSTVVWLHVEAGNQSLVERSCMCVCRYNFVCGCNCIFDPLFIHYFASLLLVCKPFCLCDTHTQDVCYGVYHAVVHILYFYI
jgi:hypothetical protein